MTIRQGRMLKATFLRAAGITAILAMGGTHSFAQKYYEMKVVRAQHTGPVESRDAVCLVGADDLDRYNNFYGLPMKGGDLDMDDYNYKEAYYLSIGRPNPSLSTRISEIREACKKSYAEWGQVGTKGPQIWISARPAPEPGAH